MDFMEMAWPGQAETHCPQPVQTSSCIRSRPTPPWRISKTSACSPHASVQLWQVMPKFNKQEDWISALRCHAAALVSEKTASGQSSAQAPQNVQPERSKLTTGVPAGPAERIFSSHLLMQSPHAVHLSRMRDSLAHGGRNGECPCLSSPKRDRSLASAISPASRCRRAKGQLRHPDRKTVCANEHEAQNWRQEYSQENKHTQFLCFGWHCLRHLQPSCTSFLQPVATRTVS